MFKNSIDHFILGINDLEKGMKEFALKTGIDPVFGGIHEGAGTHNALVSLGNNQYLEILAPLKKGTATGFGDFSYENLTAIGWIIKTNNSERVLPILEKYAIPNTGIRPLSRKTNDGKLLKWTNIFHSNDGQLSLNPFFIEWNEDTPHPSLATPKGCRLNDFTIQSTGSDAMTLFLQSLDLGLHFSKKENVTSGVITELALDTPLGKVTF